MAKKKGLTFYEKEKKLNKSVLREICSTIFCSLAAVFLAFVLVYSVGMKVSMIGISMEPELYNGQELLVNRFIYSITSPRRGDVVAFLPSGNKNSHYYVKRVIGLPGETLQIVGGYVYINGERLMEDERYDKVADSGIAENEVVLATDEFFVLGDNRNNSEDSRSGNIGAVKKETIAGKVWFHLPDEKESMGFVN